MRNKAYSAHVAVGLLAGLVATTFVAAPAMAGDAPPKAIRPLDDGRPAAAPAKPPTKKQKDGARKAYGEGEKAFNAGRLRWRHHRVHEGERQHQVPQADYWIAKSLDKQNKTEDAIAAYEALLASPDLAKLGDDKVADAKGRLDSLKAMLVAEVAIDTDPMLANIAVDGAPQAGEAPMTSS
jgi:Ni/Co efflux regulator RcnB